MVHLEIDRANALWDKYNAAQAALCEEIADEGFDPDSIYFEREVDRRERELRKQFPWDEMVAALG